MTKTLSFASSREWCDSGHRIAFSADAFWDNHLSPRRSSGFWPKPAQVATLCRDTAGTGLCYWAV